jgi:general stress protein 26
MNVQSASQENIARLAKLIKGIKMALLTSVAADGSLHSRPMATLDRDFDGTLWFFTSAGGRTADEVEEHRQVNVSYAMPEKQHYVSVSGTASLVRDREKITELWNPLFKAWFPRGQEDPDLALLRVDVEQAEYWDAAASSLVPLVQRSGLTGE